MAWPEAEGQELATPQSGVSRDLVSGRQGLITGGITCHSKEVISRETGAVVPFFNIEHMSIGKGTGF